MFDTYHAQHLIPGDTHVSITEKRAPTDESIRLLREMEEAVQKRMISAVRVDSTTFNCVVQVHKDYRTGDHTLMAIFVVNGKKMTAQYTMNMLGDDAESAVIGLRNAVSEKIANHIAEAFDNDMMMRLRR